MVALPSPAGFSEVHARGPPSRAKGKCRPDSKRPASSQVAPRPAVKTQLTNPATIMAGDARKRSPNFRTRLGLGNGWANPSLPTRSRLAARGTWCAAPWAAAKDPHRQGCLCHTPPNPFPAWTRQEGDTGILACDPEKEPEGPPPSSDALPWPRGFPPILVSRRARGRSWRRGGRGGSRPTDW